jgi:SRSO17 transposase
MTVGLLSPLPKKNGWTLAEQAARAHPGRIQTFLCQGAWERPLEAQVRDLVVESPGDDRDGVLIVDDTQLIKKGIKSVGVAPQHCGSTNQIENCQVIVMLAYARLSERGGGHAFIGHRLYLPERWTKDPDRCREAGVPKEVVFATKPHQAVELFAEADEAGVPYGWIAGDGGYGQYREVRDWPTERSRRYVMAVPSSQPLARMHGTGRQAPVTRVDDLLARATRWERRSCGHGAEGERLYDWAFFTVTLPDEPPADGFTHTLSLPTAVGEDHINRHCAGNGVERRWPVRRRRRPELEGAVRRAVLARDGGPVLRRPAFGRSPGGRFSTGRREQSPGTVRR